MCGATIFLLNLDKLFKGHGEACALGSMLLGASLHLPHLFAS